jgi:uncharacterized membrane protein
MGIDIERTESCQAPLDVAYAYLADYREVPRWMYGVEKFEVVGDNDYGPGSEFDATVNLGVRIRTRIRATEWEENRVIGMDSVKGFKVRSRWYFEADGDDRTTVTAKISYELPFGPAGRTMGKVMGPFVKRAVTESAGTLVTNIEELARRERR